MSFPGAGGDNSVFVSIGGNSVPLVDALKVAADAFGLMAEAAAATGAAFDAMGAASTVGADGLARAAGGASETGAAFDNLATQARVAAESMAQVGATGAGSRGGAWGGLFAGLGGGNGLIGMFEGLGGAITTVLDPMVGFVRQAGAMVAGLISFSVLNDVIQEVEGFTDALVQLNIQTEKNQFSWRYLYGGGNTPQGAAIAQQMADWTKSFSMQIPYTRQDLLNAITSLAPTGLSAQGLEHYMPVIADLAATRDPNATLAQVANVIMSASMGYTRMLKYDLKINPEDLIQYGLDATGTGTGIHINNPQTLLPALENYAKAKGLSGAAQDIAHDTFWGAWSSFIDRIQNFELDSGHGLFGSLKTQLNDLSSWIDTHTDQINRFAALFSDTVAGAFKTAAGWVGDFLTGLGQSGLFDFLNITPPKSTTTATNKKEGGGANDKVPRALTNKKGALIGSNIHTPTAEPPPDPTGWQQAGAIIGKALKDIGEGWDAVSQMWSPVVKQEVDDLSTAFKGFMNSFTPEEKDTLKQIGGILLSIPWAFITGALWFLARGFDLLSVAVPLALDVIRGLAEGIGHIKDKIGDFLGTLGKLKDKFGDVSSDLGKLKDKFTTWAGDLKDKFLTWGGDLIQNLADGIKNSTTSVLKPALDTAAHVIQSIFHHSKPDVGPLANDDTWMPDMMAMFARQIREGTPHMASAMAGVASAMANGMRPSGGYLPSGAAGAAGAGGTVIVINGSSTLEVMKVIDYALSKHGRNANLEMRASSGYGLYQFGTLGGH